MKKWIRFLFVLGVLAVCSGCGSSSSVQPTSFVTVGSNRLNYLTWNLSHETIIGTFIETSSDKIEKMPFTGTIHNEQVSMTFSDISIEPWSGTIQGDTLTLSTTNVFEGFPGTWYAISPSDYTQLSSDFTASLKLQGLLDQTQQDSSSPPDDSSSRLADTKVTNTQNDINTDQEKIDSASDNSITSCLILSANPINESADSFVLSTDETPSFYSLNQDMNAINQQWTIVQKLKFPSISGLSYTWRVTGTQVQSTVDAAKQTEKNVKTQVSNDQTTLNNLKQTYQSLQKQATQRREQSCTSTS